MKTVIIIPARYKSVRFPGKALIDIMGKPLIQYVYENALKIKEVDEIYIATDDSRIYNAVIAFGGKVVMTSPLHKSGGDRVAEAAKYIETDIIVNLQGDEPVVEPESVYNLIITMKNDPTLNMTTLIHRIKEMEEFKNPNVVKAVIDKEGYALYFSRAPIPFDRAQLGDNYSQISLGFDAYRHVGIYAYRKEFLLKISSISPAPLEQLECLEQLRVLEYGYKIKTIPSNTISLGIDTPEDLEKFKEYLRLIEK